jgi:hypothetical protein
MMLVAILVVLRHLHRWLLLDCEHLLLQLALLPYLLLFLLHCSKPVCSLLLL